VCVCASVCVCVYTLLLLLFIIVPGSIEYIFFIVSEAVQVSAVFAATAVQMILV